MLRKRFNRALGMMLTVLIILSFAACAGSAPATATSASSSPAATASAEPVKLLISAAASLTDAMNEIGTLYEAENKGAKITFTFGSSGSLQTQIEEGAPSDIFMSAAKKQMDALKGKDLILTETRKDLLLNDVVLIVPKGSDKEIAGYEDVLTGKVSKIALGEPKSVPAGQYAEEIFTFLKGLDTVKVKAVYGSDVRQVLTWVESGDVDCGVVYKTDAATSKNVTVVAKAPEGSHQPVVYPVAVLKSSKQADAAAKFLTYLSSEKAGAVFEKYGFTLSK